MASKKNNEEELSLVDKIRRVKESFSRLTSGLKIDRDMDDEDEDEGECDTPGKKKRSKGKGRGLGIGKGRGPLRRGRGPLRRGFEESAELMMEELRLSKGDKKVIRAFADKKAAISKKLDTDGQRLDGLWMGGRKLAYWDGDKVQIGDIGGRAGQTVANAVRKMVPKFDLAEGAELGEASGSGTGPFRQDKKLTTKDFSKLKVGDILINEGHRFNAVNVVRVTRIREKPSRGFNAIFADPKNTKKSRMSSDNEFFVWADDLDDIRHSSTFYWAKKGVREGVELDEAKRYYLLVGKQSAQSPFEVIFGDYSRETVEDEKDAEGGSWKKVKIVTAPNASQKTLDVIVKKMNESMGSEYIRVIEEASSKITVVPAYGRDYKSENEARSDWNANKDFMVHDVSSKEDGRYINKSDAKRGGIKQVNIRFKKLRSAVVVDVKD